MSSTTPYRLFVDSKGKEEEQEEQEGEGEDDDEEGGYGLERKSQVREDGFKARVEPWRQVIRRWNESLVWHVVILILVLIDAGILIGQLATGKAAQWGVIMGNCILGIFVFDISLRMFGFGREFFRSVLNIYDLIIISLSFLLAFLTDLGQYLVIGRLISRSILLLLKFQQQRKRIPDATRKIISENKMRFQEDGFDLDLAYVTPRLIVMSVPAIKLERFYRNDLKEVARFFNTRHRDHYLIFNMCEEREYPTDKFENRVIRYPIADHNVPTLSMILQFLQAVQRWYHDHPTNIVAVHCRGGKGRSGTMVCAWLLYSRHSKTAKEALEFFGQQRTDTSKGSKYQGVETRSQCRYIHYLEHLIIPLLRDPTSQTYLNNYTQALQLPPPRPLLLTQISLALSPTLSSVCQWTDWHFVITHNGGKKLSAPIRLSKTSEQAGDSVTSHLTFATSEASSQFHLLEDVRFEFVGLSGKGKPKILFYWWFHTYFVENNSPSSSSNSIVMRLDKDDVDRGRFRSCPFKKKVSSLTMDLYFAPASDDAPSPTHPSLLGTSIPTQFLRVSDTL